MRTGRKQGDKTPHQLTRPLKKPFILPILIEEPLMPDECAAHAKLAKNLEGLDCTIHFATGEHECTHHGFQQLIDAGGISAVARRDEGGMNHG